MSALIADSSAVAGIIFPSQRTAYSLALDEALHHRQEVIVPALFLIEMTNVILVQARRLHLSTNDVQTLLDRINAIPSRIVDLRNIHALAAIAKTYALTAYDAAYLALALEERAPLATLDEALKKAAIAEKLFYNPSS